jgi:hypothetical protein
MQSSRGLFGGGGGGTARTESGIAVDWNSLNEGARADTDNEFRTLLLERRGDVGPGDQNAWLAGALRGEKPLALAPRGWGTAWTNKSPPNYADRAHALLGSTVDTGRVYDAISVVRTLELRDKRTQLVKEARIRLVGRGQTGIVAAYAALLEPSMAGERRIKEVVIVDPPASHRNGPIFLNVLSVLDIPETLGMLAPDVKLTLINAKDKAFDRTAQLYKLAGAEDKFERK